MPRRRAQTPLGAQSRAGCGTAFLLMGGRPPGGQAWAGGGPGHPDSREMLEPHILWSLLCPCAWSLRRLLWPRHQGREGPASFQPQAGWSQPCGIHTCGKLEYSLQEINQQKKKKVAFGSAIESSPLTWSVRSPVTPHRKPCLQGPPPGHSCLLSQRPIPQGVLEPTGHSREEGWLGLALPALVPSPGSWAHTRMGPRARGSASPHAPQQAGKGKQQREAMVLGGLAGSMGAATGSTMGEGHRPWQALPFLGWPPHP